jgi:hypothetical protein
LGLFRKRNTYKCGTCGAKDCKLWREHGIYSRVILKCAPCAAEYGKRDISSIDGNGTRLTPEYDWAGDKRSDQIGWYVPAVPTDDEFEAYWGITSTPLDAYQKWQLFPTLPKGYKL